MSEISILSLDVPSYRGDEEEILSSSKRASGLDVKSKLEASHFPPDLPPPSANPLSRAFKEHQRRQNLDERKVLCFQKEAEEAFQKIDELSSLRQVAFLKSLELEKKKTSWESLSSVAGMIAHVGSTMAGLSIGGIPGYLLAASGIAGGFIKVLDETYLLDSVMQWLSSSQEKQAKIREKILSGAFYLQVGLSAAGVFYGWKLGTFASWSSLKALTSMEKFSGAVGIAASIAQIGSQVGASYSNKLLADCLSSQRKIDLEIKEKHLFTVREAKEIQGQIDTQMNQTRVIQGVIRNQPVHFD